MRITLRALKPKAYPEKPQTIGEHVKKRRAETGMSQSTFGRLLKVSPFTVAGWERGRIIPPTVIMGRVIRWLGYDPLPQGETLAERLRAKRRATGWSQSEAAQHLGVDRSVFAKWEAGGKVYSRPHRIRLAEFTDLPETALPLR